MLIAVNKTFIPQLVILVIFSLVGLIAIQFYWIKNSVALREAQFTRNVKMALRDVNNTLERHAATERMMKNTVSQRILNRIDSLQRGYATGLSHPSQAVRPEEDSTVNSNVHGNYSLKYSRQSKDFLLDDSLGLVPSKPSDFDGYFREFDARIIVELLTGLMNIDINPNFIESYRLQEMDSLLQSSLSAVGGIETPYHFAVFDAQDRPTMVSRGAQEYMDQLQDSPYSIRLFPHDYRQNSIFLNVYFPERKTFLISTLRPLLASSALFILVIVLVFVYSIRTILRQKKISEIKNDFINNMTHELRTPISTISLACEALSDPVMQQSSGRVGNYVNMIRDENNRLGLLVENVLRSALLDRSEIEFGKEPVNMHKIIESVIKTVGIQIAGRGGELIPQLDATNPVVMGDEIHLTNVLYNLLDNALKYTKTTPIIQIKTENTPTGFRLSVTDNGMGIKKDERGRIFDKLYRVPTGNVHDIKGFGLGLSYVKTVVEKHGGHVSVDSVYGKGSTFNVEIPINQ